MVKSNRGIPTAEKRKREIIPMEKKKGYGKDGLELVNWNPNLNTKMDCGMDYVSIGIPMEKKHFRFTKKKGNITVNGWSGMKQEI